MTPDNHTRREDDQITRTDYEKEKIAVLLREYFKKRADTAALQAEIENKYPDIAAQLREELPDMKALHEHAEAMIEAMAKNQSDDDEQRS